MSRDGSDVGLILILLFVAALASCGILGVAGVSVVLPPA
jgi:Na+/serine symporter